MTTDSSAPSDRDLNSRSTLRNLLIELEYNYLTQSSFRSDELRDRLIQFYLLIVSTAAAIILGVTQLLSREPTWSFPVNGDALTVAFGALALFIGFVGVVMIPIFARLRRVVLESLQGTVLLKRFSQDLLGDKELPNAFIWDANSLPRDEQYLTASFLLVFVLMVLDTVMLTLPLYLWSSAAFAPGLALLWSLVAALPLLTIQVIAYRWLLWRELTDAARRDRLDLKWEQLGMPPLADAKPQLHKPLLQAVLVGGGATLILLFAALVASMGRV